MNVIRKIFEGKADDNVHSDFLKFGRGEFKDKYLISGKKQKDLWSIKTGPEFANYFVRKGLEKAKGKKIDVKGIMVSTFDLKNEAKFNIEKVKKFMGIQQAVINTQVMPEEILSFMEKFPRVFYALSFKLPDYELKIKEKAPKSGKPGNKGDGEELKIDFCSLKTLDREVIKDLLFDCPEFKEIVIRHTLQINDIVYPKDEKDPQKVREMSKRKGILVRNIEIDGRKEVKKADFFA